MTDFESIDPLWRLVDPLSVAQAASLIVGTDPNRVLVSCDGEPYNSKDEKNPICTDDLIQVRTALLALVHAINGNTLKAVLKYDAYPLYLVENDHTNDRLYANPYSFPELEDEQGNVFGVHPIPSWNDSTVACADLREWLSRKGYRSGFFFPNATDAPDYLDPGNPRYPPKLAAAVRAWQAVTDPSGKHPKQALMKWLREHAAEFGLTDEEGKPNETGIEEVAKVANWQPGGGAPKTPGG